MTVPIFVKHVATSDEVVAFNSDDIFVDTVLCTPGGYDIIYWLHGVGDYGSVPDGHELYEYRKVTTTKQTKAKPPSRKRKVK